MGKSIIPTTVRLDVTENNAWMMGTIAFQVPPFCQMLYSPQTPTV